MEIKFSDRTEEIKEYFFSKKLKEISKLNSEGKKIINLGIGSPDMAPHKNVIKNLKKVSRQNDVHGYQQYNGIEELRKSFKAFYKKHYNVALNYEKNILPLIGSKEGVFYTSMAFLNKDDYVLIPNPGYPSYSSISKMLGVNIIKYNLYKENNWYPKIKELNSFLQYKPKLMWINYPNMPTGSDFKKSKIIQIINWAKSNNIIVCNDNPYSFILNKKPKSIFSIDSSLDNCIELNSLSKSHNMAGWRVGVLVGNDNIVGNILKVKSNIDSGMFRPLQTASCKALSLNKRWFKELNKVYEERKNIAKKIFDFTDCSYEKNTVGMFLWGKVSNKYKNGRELSDYLLYKKNVFITPGEIFGSNGNMYVRISLCSKKEILKNALTNIKTL